MSGSITGAALAALALIVAVVSTSATAATPDEEAALDVGRQWAKAVTTGNVDVQMRLLPPTMFAKDDDRERARKRFAHDNEVALIRRQKYSAFELGSPLQTLKVGQANVVVIPYKAIVESPEGRLQTDSSLIAVALDGSKWSVFDGSGQNTKSLKPIIPGYTAGLNVPPAKAAVIKPE